MDASIESLVYAVVRARNQKEKKVEEEQTISVSDTISAAASAYEALRNTLEYDEEHPQALEAAMERGERGKVGRGFAPRADLGALSSE